MSVEINEESTIEMLEKEFDIACKYGDLEEIERLGAILVKKRKELVGEITD